ncbi:MAG: HEAT repeat domain-containing protein, partial [Methanotrichaceae archaeon]|nr:HEAT repeat domain-containing protein [Methanotrichaceae archaeon]
EFTCQEALDGLAHSLKDSEPMVREAALKSLARIRSEGACDLALSALKDEDYRVRLTAVTSLGEIGQSKALEPLVDVMFGQDEQEIRAWAAWSLGEIGDPRAVEPLRRAYKTCPVEVMKKAKDSLLEVFKTEP